MTTYQFDVSLPEGINEFFQVSQPDDVGNIIGADDVRDQVKYIITKWAPFYTAVLSDRLVTAGKIGGDSQVDAPLTNFGTWVNEPQYRSYGTGQSPTFLVTVPMTVGNPLLQANGRYIVVWRTQIVTQVFGTTWEEAADLISWYEKIVRWCILQNRSLEQFAMSTKWQGVTFRGDEHDGTRTVAQAVSLYDVQVRNAIDVLGLAALTNPPFPPIAPPSDPTVESTLITVEDFPATGSVT